MPARRLRKSPRLKDFDYIGPLAAHLIFVTDYRKPHFARQEPADLVVDCLRDAALRHGAKIHAYCFMPDHAHVLVEIGEGASLEAFATLFKQLSGFRVKQLTGEAVWQPSFWDNVLRRDEDLADVAAYIWQNPVKAGLVAGRTEYPWSGPAGTLREASGDPERYSPPRSFLG